MSVVLSMVLELITVPVHVPEPALHVGVGVVTPHAPTEPQPPLAAGTTLLYVVALPTLVTSPVKLALIEVCPAVKPAAVPVAFVATSDEGVPPAPLKRTGAPAEPGAMPSAVATPAPSPEISVIAGCEQPSTPLVDNVRNQLLDEHVND